ncbi:MAG: LptF/LptG family permease [Taibaiella sp.]|nr:LptF/LptG family permease [Taibaiella sp.]
MLKIKKLDIYLIKSFIGPFIVVYFVVLFAFVMQNFWLYMDEILGKGLGFWPIAQYLTNLGVLFTPLALPLALLLTGIMTFGNLGEHFELAAIKSAGVSLVRFMRPLLYFAIFVGILSFLINNFIMPVMNLKTYSLLYDMRKKKPALNLQEGIFSKIFDGYTIRIGGKDENGQNFSDVIIYDHNGKTGNRNVTIAKRGKLMPSPDNRYLVFELEDGWRYDEGEDKREMEQTRMYFEKWNKVFDLSKFEFKRTEEDLFKHNEKMMNAGQLYLMMDSMERKKILSYDMSRKQIKKYLSILDTAIHLGDHTNPAVSYQDKYLELIPDSLKSQYLSYMDGHLRASKSYLFNSVNEVTFNSKRQNKLSIEFNDKFSMAFACVVLFLIGAPLGGIIRKGGIGMPVVVGIIFFVVYFILSSTGRKLAEEEKLSAWFGVWMATLSLMPVALIVIYQAKNDSRLMTKETYVRLWRSIRSIFKKEK